MNKQSIICFIAFTVFVDVNAIVQSPATGSVNGHEYVDLGLSVKWATCNIGASSPSDYGDYFAWGEAETKDNFGSVPKQRIALEERASEEKAKKYTAGGLQETVMLISNNWIAGAGMSCKTEVQGFCLSPAIAMVRIPITTT